MSKLRCSETEGASLSRFGSTLYLRFDRYKLLMQNNKRSGDFIMDKILCISDLLADELATCACESCTSRLYLSNTLEQASKQILLSLHAGKSKLVCPGTEGTILYMRFEKYKVLMQINNRNGYFVMNQVAEDLKSHCPETQNAFLS